MYIVYVNDKKHSAWISLLGALHQIEVLEGYGYTDCYYDYIETREYVNGHYFV